MNPVLTCERFQVHVGHVIAFPASVSERPPKQLSALSADHAEMVRSISAILGDLVVSTIQKRTVAEFTAARDEAFPKYFAAMGALSALTSIVAPPQVVDRVSNEFFCEMEAGCREHALAAFGRAVRDQLMFTIWTLRKTADLCRQITAAPLPEELKKTDAELGWKYAQSAVWARFHLDCLLQSMQQRIPIYPDVHELVIEGLRAAVNAYAWAKQGIDLRLPRRETEPAPIEWDEEERALLNEATFDVIRDPA